MTEENVAIVRQPLRARRRSHRHLDEWVLVLSPALLRLATRALWRLPPSSWARRKLMARAIRTCFEAFNRRDLESAFALYDSNVETTFPAQLASLGFPARTHGRRERIDAQRRWNDEWGEFRNEPEELVDLGDRVLILGRLVGSGLSSGVGFDTEVAYLFDVIAGRAIREEMFVDQKAALDAAGVPGELGERATRLD